MASEASASSADAAWSSDSALAMASSSSTDFCLSVLACSLLAAMDSSKVWRNSSCSSMSVWALSTTFFLVARSIFAPSILFLSSVYSGPILDAISCSFAWISAIFASRCLSISALESVSDEMDASRRPICSATEACLAVSIWSLRWAYCALAVSRAACASRYLWASCLSWSSLWIWTASSSITMPILSRLVSASALSVRAFSMSASKLDMPEMPSMMRRRSMLLIWTMRVTSPCWTRLYPSADILALVRRASNSDIVDLRSLT